MPLTPEYSASLIQQDFAYAYDSAGNVGTITHSGWTDDLGHTSTYTYDSMNRLTGLIDALGHSRSYAYDAIGNRTHAAETLFGLYSSTNSDFSDREPRTTSYAYTRLYPK
jgi:YD repeat-containing protein